MQSPTQKPEYNQTKQGYYSQDLTSEGPVSWEGPENHADLLKSQPTNILQEKI